MATTSSYPRRTLRHWANNLSGPVLAAALALMLASSAGADTIRTAAGIGYHGEIVGVGDEGIEIRVGGSPRTVPFKNIRSVSAEEYPKLEQAEELIEKGAKDDADAMAKAAKLYEALLVPEAPDWLRTLVQWRMYDVHARSGEMRKALEAYLEIAEKSPRLVAGFELPQPREDDHQANKAALRQVKRVLRQHPDAPYADALKEFRISLLLLEGEPKEILASGVLDQLLKSDKPKVRAGAMLRKLELLLALDRVKEAGEWWEEVQASDAPIASADMAYWRGRVLEGQGQPIQAALAYMRLPILHARKNPSRTAEALWRTGKALEAAEAPADEIKVVYREAVKEYPGTVGAERAKRELTRLGAK